VPEQRRLSGHGQPLTDALASIKAPGGSRGTPGLNAVQRAIQFRDRPMTRCPRTSVRVARPGALFGGDASGVMVAGLAACTRCPRTSVRGFLSTGTRPGGPGQHQQTAFAKKKRHDVVFFVNKRRGQPLTASSVCGGRRGCGCWRCHRPRGRRDGLGARRTASRPGLASSAHRWRSRSSRPPFSPQPRGGR